ncbi:MAG: hypothetical protein PHF67_04195, partial [Candidatus Nanoarchaeia archaeon]|nr:hypothetical protein [Candidatus Nanoarchaeia archaeon]
LHAMPYAGKTPEDCSVAVIGRKRVGTAAVKQLELLGVPTLDIYHTGNSQELKQRIGDYDVIVDCACSNDEILTSGDLSKMKPGALFIDMGRSCMWGSYSAQSIYAPTVLINDGRNLVYCVKNIPTLAYQTATRHNSRDVAPYINMLVKREMDKVLKDAVVVDKGVVVDEKV